MLKVKRILSLVFVVVLALSLTGCAACNRDDSQRIDIERTTEGTTEDPGPAVLNPLTGVSGFNPDLLGQKPVAVIINNIRVAQGVQSGVGSADMVFETVAEGGITRLLAVYSDISQVERIGTVRSARITYVQLAAGLGAFLVHAGADNRHAGPARRSALGVTSLDVGGNAARVSQRIRNGLAWEHTLFVFGQRIADFTSNLNTELRESAQDVYTFRDEDEPESFETPATNISIAFSSAYRTTMTFDEETGRYARGSAGGPMRDHLTGEPDKFTNVFALFTSIGYMPNGVHTRIDLSSGEGYYFSNGTGKPIRWEKNGETAPMRFFNTDGSPLVMNAGNSYIGITSTRHRSRLSVD